jgi:glycosyltransferase involved in cell wall biosynthesis
MNPADPNRPLVSVIIPAFNAQPFLRQTLESVRVQTCRHFEVIIVDDGSTDGTVLIAQSVANADPRFRLLQQPHNGVAAARNLAVAHAVGEFIAPLDADDIWHPEKLRLQVRALQDAPAKVALVYSPSVCIDAHGDPVGHIQFEPLVGNVLWEIVLRNFLTNASCALIRRRALEQVGGYADLRAYAQGSEDWDLYLRLAEHYEFAVVPQVLIGYRQIPASMSASYRGMEASHRRVFEVFRARHPELPEALCRWAAARHLLYLRGKSSACGDYIQSLRYLARAWRTDPLLLVDLKTYIAFVKCLLKMSLARRFSAGTARVGIQNYSCDPALDTGRAFRSFGSRQQSSRLTWFGRLHQARFNRLKRSRLIETNRSEKQPSVSTQFCLGEHGGRNAPVLTQARAVDTDVRGPTSISVS